jgi:hypothetical protein
VSGVGVLSGGQVAPNLSLVRARFTRFPTAISPVVFQARPADFAFNDAAGPWNGVCQACHTQTLHHRNTTGSDHDHGVGGDCASCHQHKTGFVPSNCLDCHATARDDGNNVPPGGRRGLASEIPATTAHSHLGPNPNASCAVCHDQSTHGDGYVDLRDPDVTAQAWRFLKPSDLAASPDVSDFCLHCHDADGATAMAAPMDPLGTGTAPMNVAARCAGTLRWNELYGDFCFGTEGTLRAVNSHHDISDADQAWSGGKVECLDCHAVHSATPTQKLGDPDQKHLPWVGTTSDFCLRCHGGGNGPADPGLPAGVSFPVGLFDSANATVCAAPGPGCVQGASIRGLGTCNNSTYPWYVENTWAHSAHGPDSKRAWPGYSGAPGTTMECVDCHDAHGSATANNPAGNPYMIRDLVDGTAMVDDGNRPQHFNGPSFSLFGLRRVVEVGVTPGGGGGGDTVDWGGTTGLCSACHSTWQAAYEWHSMCTSCQTCHAHGAAFGETDYGGGNRATWCP